MTTPADIVVSKGNPDAEELAALIGAIFVLRNRAAVARRGSEPPAGRSAWRSAPAREPWRTGPDGWRRPVR